MNRAGTAHGLATAIWSTGNSMDGLMTEVHHVDGTLYEAALEANIPLPTLDNFMRVMGFSVDFQRQLRQNFLDVANKHSDRIKIIDGNQSPQQVAAQIIESVETLVK